MALELDRSLEEWYVLLPEFLRFNRDFPIMKDLVDDFDRQLAPVVDEQVALLRMDYFGISAVIHWPLMNSIKASNAVDLDPVDVVPVKKFLNAVFRYIAALTPLLQYNHPNLWTVAHG
jgi:hypothetical protein